MDAVPLPAAAKAGKIARTGTARLKPRPFEALQHEQAATNQRSFDSDARTRPAKTAGLVFARILAQDDNRL
jgi:hypothetical protein